MEAECCLPPTVRGPVKSFLTAGSFAASLLVALPLLPASGQSAPASAAAAPAASTADSALPAPSQGQLDAARELLLTMDAEHVMVSAAITSIRMQGANNPFLAPYQDVLESWARKYLTWEAVGPGMTRLYAASFTEPELRQLTAFYRSPVGQKSLTVMPELMQRGSDIGAQIGKAHAQELVEMIQARQKELQQLQEKSAAADSSHKKP